MIFTRFINLSFSKVMIATVIGLVIVNGYLWNTKKAVLAELTANQATTEVKNRENQHLANSLENAHLQIADYKRQIKDLHNNVLAHIKQAENRSNELLQELENVKTWSNQPVPSNISWVFKQRQHNLSGHKSDTATLPDGSDLPKPKNQPKD